MKHYDKDTVFGFGKFQGQTLAQVAALEPGYINWCILNLDHFYIGEEELEALAAQVPGFAVTEEAVQQLDKRYADWVHSQPDYDHDDDYDYEERTFDRYNGSYAQDEMGYSDQDIDDAFDGEADAYWNID